MPTRLSPHRDRIRSSRSDLCSVAGIIRDVPSRFADSSVCDDTRVKRKGPGQHRYARAALLLLHRRLFVAMLFHPRCNEHGMKA